MSIRLLDRITSRESEADPIVDPRIAARRDAVRGARRRRRVRLLLIPVTIGLVLAALWFLSRTALFDVDHIRVTGTTRLQADDVVAASGVHTGEPLLQVDTGAVARAVEREPWILTAKVTRSVNGVVAIAVTERTPVATVLGPDGVALWVDGSGRVLGPVAVGDGVLPRLDGVAPVEPGDTVVASDGALQLAALLTPGVRARSVAIVTTADGQLQLQLQPQGTVDLGTSEDLAIKVASLVTVMGQVDQRDLCTIRVINPETPVVTRTPNCR